MKYVLSKYQLCQQVTVADMGMLIAVCSDVLYIYMDEGIIISSSSKMISSGSTTEKYDIVNNVAINVISNCHLLLGRTPETQLENLPPRTIILYKSPSQETTVGVKSPILGHKVRKFHKCIHKLSLTLF